MDIKQQRQFKRPGRAAKKLHWYVRGQALCGTRTAPCSNDRLMISCQTCRRMLNELAEMEEGTRQASKRSAGRTKRLKGASELTD